MFGFCLVSRSSLASWGNVVIPGSCPSPPCGPTALGLIVRLYTFCTYSGCTHAGGCAQSAAECARARRSEPGVRCNMPVQGGVHAGVFLECVRSAPSVRWSAPAQAAGRSGCARSAVECARAGRSDHNLQGGVRRGRVERARAGWSAPVQGGARPWQGGARPCRVDRASGRVERARGRVDRARAGWTAPVQAVIPRS